MTIRKVCRFSPFAVSLALALNAPAQQFHAAGLQAAATYSRQCDGRGLVVWQNGRVLVENYANGGSARRPVHVRSVSKSLWSLAVLAAIDARKFSLDSKAADFIPEWRDSQAKSAITVRELLTMTGGLAPSTTAIYHDGGENLRAVIADLPSRAPAGQVWEYGASEYESLGEVLRRVFPQSGGPEAWLRQTVTLPCHMNQPLFKRDKKGVCFLSAGASMTARDLLNLGIGILGGGPAAVGPQTLRDAFTGTALNSAYGMGFWLNANAARPDAVEAHMEDLLSLPGRVDWNRVCFSHAAPADMIVMLGSSGQRVFVCPSWKTVIVRQGESDAWRDAKFWSLLTR